MASGYLIKLNPGQKNGSLEIHSFGKCVSLMTRLLFSTSYSATPVLLSGFTFCHSLRSSLRWAG